MYLHNFFKHYWKTISLALLIFILLEAVIVASMEYLQDKDIQSYEQIHADDSSTHIETVHTSVTHNADIFYKTLIEKPQMLDIMDKASQTSDEKELESLRNELAGMYKETYSYLKTNGVRQLHFHLPGSVSFLRFHRPQKFGDSLQGVREDVEYVNKNHMAISCFTEGRIFNGFRNVYPIFKGKRFVGTVEVSYLFSALQSKLLEMTRSSYLFLVKKNVVEKKVFKNELFRYEKSEFEDFSYDIATLHDLMEIRLEYLQKINTEIKDRARERMDRGDIFSIIYRNEELFDNQTILVSFIPVKNLDNKAVAYIVNYEFGNNLEILLNKYTILYIVLHALAFLASVVVFLISFYYRKKHEEMEYLASHDALTKIYNRHGVNSLFNQKIEEYRRFKRDLSLIFFDIDYFKRVNDTYGHEIGDYVLESIAKIIGNHIRTSDILARWGGEEFIIILPETNRTHALEVAEKFRTEIELHVFYEIDKVTCSFGVTSMKEGDTKNTILKRVDELMYQAKKRGSKSSDK